ncbi:hypothetical protein L218DRAFT_554401 [Marasmius fiardii PR-910]|nr:hypothetical protein L218DRAFT_554401 [Marasmius fiardii PR-910]
MAISSSDTDAVTSQLYFLIPPPDGSPAYQIVDYESNKGEPGNVTGEPHDIVVENIRGKEHLYTLDNAGFQFFNRPSKHSDLNKELEEYKLESAEIVKEITGAKHVVLYECVRRLRPSPGNHDAKKRRPAVQVHVDVNESFSIEALHQYAPPSENKESLQNRRFQIINLWRPLSHPAYDWPLALCDYSSVDLNSDLFTITRKHAETAVKYNPKHQWKYLRGMKPDEILLLKNYDSDKSVANFAPHGAFDDPTAPEDTPPRESVELRFLVIYD